jgi:aerobic carbon-monoxide dehydrogenase medium subunit
MPNIEFLRPRTVTEAVSLLASHPGTRCIAGGQTLVAMMNAGLVAVNSLISIEGIAELCKIEERDGKIWIGAAVSHRNVAVYRFSGAHRIICDAASVIAHPAIRNFGTIGGSLAHGDPASDYPTAIVAANAAVEIAGAQQRRTVPATEFFLDYLTTALDEDEIVTAVILSPASARSAGHFLKFSRVDGDYGIISIGVTLTFGEDGICTQARLAAGGLGPKPLWCVEADGALCGTRCEDAAIGEAAHRLLELADPIDDVRASAEYRRALLPKLLRRAVHAVSSRAAEGLHE